MRRSGPAHDAPPGSVEGPPLVLLHSAAGSSASWYRCVEPWARARPVLAVDTIGCAGRLVATRPIGAVADLVAWFDELMDEMSLVTAAMEGFRERLPFPRRLSDDELASIACPALVLLAEDSVVSSPRKAAARVRSTLPSARVETVPGAGHGLPFQFTDLVTGLVDDFVTGVPA